MPTSFLQPPPPRGEFRRRRPTFPRRRTAQPSQNTPTLPSGLFLRAALSSLLVLTLHSAAAAEDAPPPRPNVVLLISDQWRKDWTSFDLPQLRTPTFEKIARLGTRFTQAITPSPLCKPARASLATGLTYPKHGVRTSVKQVEVSIANRTIFQLLRDRGVWTMLTGKDDLTLLGKFYGNPCSEGKCGARRATSLGLNAHHRCYGKEFMSRVSQPVDPYMQYLEDRGTFSAMQTSSGVCDPTRVEAEGYLCRPLRDFEEDEFIDDWIAHSSIELIQQAPKNKPYFLQVNYAGPHPPLQVPDDMISKGASRIWPLAQNSTKLEERAQQRLRENYALLIERIDRLNQEILDAIAARGDAKNTVVCILADHGEMLGDRWDISPVFVPFQKNAPWQASIGVPLACAGPGIQKGQVVEDPVSTLDLASTVLELQGSEVPDTYDSVSLKDLLSGAQTEPRAAVSTLSTGTHSFSTAQMRLDDGKLWKLICCQGLCPVGNDIREANAADAPSNAAWEQTLDTSQWQRLLFDLTEDPLEMTNLFHSRLDVTEKLRPFLQADYQSCGLQQKPQDPTIAAAALLRRNAAELDGLGWDSI